MVTNESLIDLFRYLLWYHLQPEWSVVILFIMQWIAVIQLLLDILCRTIVISIAALVLYHLAQYRVSTVRELIIACFAWCSWFSRLVKLIEHVVGWWRFFASCAGRPGAEMLWVFWFIPARSCRSKWIIVVLHVILLVISVRWCRTIRLCLNCFRYYAISGTLIILINNLWLTIFRLMYLLH